MPLLSFRSGSGVGSWESMRRWEVAVDWDGDGTFMNPYASLEADTDGLEYIVGRDQASQLIGRSVAGRCSIHMKNDEGRYSLHNASGPLAGLLLPRRKVKVSSLTPLTGTLWTGWTTGAPQAAAAIGRTPTATLACIGPLGLLANPNLKINPAPLHNVRTGVAINAVLDAVGWPAANRIIDVGDMILGDWFPQDIGALEALQQIADAEGGFIREGRNWDIVFESRYHRFEDAASITSQATFSDAVGAALSYAQLGLSEENVYNRAEVTVTRYVQDAANSTLWHLDPITLQPGETRTIIAQYPPDVAFADTGLSSTYSVVPSTLAGSLGATPVIRARRVEYTVVNNHGSLPMAVEITLTGRAYRQGTQLLVRKEDLVSQDKYELSTYPFSSPWFSNEPYATAQAEWAVATYSEPRPLLRLSFPPADDTWFAQVIARETSDRISVVATSWQTQFGISGDFYIEQTSLRLASGEMPMFTMDLSQAEADPGWGKFDVAKFDTVGRFAR